MKRKRLRPAPRRSSTAPIVPQTAIAGSSPPATLAAAEIPAATAAIPVQESPPTPPGHAVKLAKAAIDAGETRLVAVGGDGTLSAVANSYRATDSWMYSPAMSEDAFTRLQDIIEAAGELSARVEFGSLVDNSFADKVMGVGE